MNSFWTGGLAEPSRLKTGWSAAGPVKGNWPGAGTYLVRAGKLKVRLLRPCKPQKISWQ